MYLPGIWMSGYTGSERLLGWVGFWSPAADSGRSKVLGEGVWGGGTVKQGHWLTALQAQQRPHNSRSLQKQCGALRHSLRDVRRGLWPPFMVCPLGWWFAVISAHESNVNFVCVCVGKWHFCMLTNDISSGEWLQSVISHSYNFSSFLLWGADFVVSASIDSTAEVVSVCLLCFVIEKPESVISLLLYKWTVCHRMNGSEKTLTPCTFN